MPQIFLKSGNGNYAKISELQSRIDYLEAHYVPEMLSAIIDVDGLNWTFTFDQNVEILSGGASGFSVTMDEAGEIELTYSSTGSTLDELIYTGDIELEFSDTASNGLDYTQPGSGIVSTSGIEYPSTINFPVTNNSIVNEWDGTGALPHPTGTFTYTTEGTNPNIQLITQGAPNVTWEFQDGTVLDGPIYTPTHTLATGDRQTHTVTVDPYTGVTRINRNNIQLIGMNGLGNLPEINYLYFFSWGGAEFLDLTGCINMTQWHLIGSTWTTQNFEDMMVSQANAFMNIPNGSLSGTFYDPSRVSTSPQASDAMAIITAKGIGGL